MQAQAKMNNERLFESVGDPFDMRLPGTTAQNNFSETPLSFQIASDIHSEMKASNEFFTSIEEKKKDVSPA